MEFDKAVAELETLVQTLEREGDERSLLLLQLVDAIHRPALAAMVAGDFEDPAARAILAMYGLPGAHPEDLVEAALDEVRPYIRSHGGEVELLEVTGGTARVRMSGACDGCAASAMTLQRGIETAIREHWPEVQEVVAEPAGGEGAAAPQLLQIESLQQAKRPVFVDAPAASGLAPGELAAQEVDGVEVLLANVEGEIYAFRDACPVDGRSLRGGRLAGAVIVCPWHNCAYDARSGARADDEPEAEGLTVVPVAVGEGDVRLAVNVA